MRPSSPRVAQVPRLGVPVVARPRSLRFTTHWWPCCATPAGRQHAKRTWSGASAGVLAMGYVDVEPRGSFRRSRSSDPVPE